MADGAARILDSIAFPEGEDLVRGVLGEALAARLIPKLENTVSWAQSARAERERARADPYRRPDGLTDNEILDQTRAIARAVHGLLHSLEKSAPFVHYNAVRRPLGLEFDEDYQAWLGRLRELRSNLELTLQPCELKGRRVRGWERQGRKGPKPDPVRRTLEDDVGSLLGSAGVRLTMTQGWSSRTGRPLGKLNTCLRVVLAAAGYPVRTELKDVLGRLCAREPEGRSRPGRSRGG